MKKSFSAFTLIEVIIVVAVFMLISIPLLFNYFNVSNSQGLKTSVGETTNLIKSAHIYSREAKDQKAWGVITRDEDTLALVSGNPASYEVEQELTLPRGIKTKEVVVVWFALGTGELQNNITVELVNQRDMVGQLLIHKTGVVDSKIL